MNPPDQNQVFDFVIIGSGFGGSVSAMRLAEKGYSVLVLEKGKRFSDADFPKTNWNFRKFLWNPLLRSFGILQISLLDGMLILHGAGVGGGSLGYANVLMEPDPRLFDAPGWREPADWRSVLRPHYETAKRMLGVTTTPRLFAADLTLKKVSEEMGAGDSFSGTQVGVFFGEEGIQVKDPFFSGQGPDRQACIYCGGCMVGCRHNAKNTLVKNYLYFAERWGVQVLAEREVSELRPLEPASPDQARYEILHCSSTALLGGEVHSVRARNVIVAAGVLGTLNLLLRCRDVARSLPELSLRLGDNVRTNSEELLGAVSRNGEIDYSQGVAIGSTFSADSQTEIQAVRYPAGSGLMRFLAAPLLSGGKVLTRLLKAFTHWLLHPIDFLRAYVFPGWSQRTTILLVMQSADNHMRLRLGRSPWTLFKRGLVSELNGEGRIPASTAVGHKVARDFAGQVEGFPAGSFSEGLLGMPSTAHILGGCPMGRTPEDGVVDAQCRVHNYPGLYVIDGSIVPANPGVNPSLTIATLAEYAMSNIAAKNGSPKPQPLHFGNAAKL